jgi:hypothetical protein
LIPALAHDHPVELVSARAWRIPMKLIVRTMAATLKHIAMLGKHFAHLGETVASEH